VLLLLERDPTRPAQPYWGTIGGAVDAGESLAEAAVRELWEETGLVADPADLTEPFHRRRTEFSWNGVAYLGDNTVFALRLLTDAPVTFEHLAEEEIGNVLDARWLTPRQAAEETWLVWPDLPDLMSDAIAAVEALS